MQIISDPQQMQRLALEWRAQGHSVALVPTMGYFHAGHESLMRAAREYVHPVSPATPATSGTPGDKTGGKMIVSLFVNPTQFGPNEDLDKYPHNLERDSAIAESLGADVLFTPKSDAVYYPDHATWVEVPQLAQGLCGETRPVHFRGVATVVCKLFMLTQANAAFFGEKDWQQLAIIRRMARDLNIPVSVRSCPIVREADGLAMSSRNVYLTPDERAQAPHLHKGLLCAEKLFRAGERSCAVLAKAVREYLAENLPLGREDYLSFVDPENLNPLENIEAKALVATAVYLGKARILDNLLIG